MSEKDDILKNIGSAEYKHGFETQVEQEFIPKGLNEDIIRLISEKKGEPQWLLDFRLKAYRKWLTMFPGYHLFRRAQEGYGEKGDRPRADGHF